MAHLNRHAIIGNIGQDLELRETNSGTPWVGFSVATNRRWTNKDTGEQQEETNWHNVVVYGPSAEACAKYLGKGSLVYVEGRSRTRTYEDNDGIERRTTEIVARPGGVQFLDRPGGNGDGRKGREKARAESTPEPAAGDDYGYDDDLPF